MKRLAIIGTGIAGMACAYRLHREFDICIYEKNNYIGGHTNTVSVLENGRERPIDTGFMVYNTHTYPKLTRLFSELGVESNDTSMSFGVQVKARGLEYACSGFDSFFAQRARLLSFRHWRLLQSIMKFFKESSRMLDLGSWEDISIGDYFKKLRVPRDMVDDFFIPMVAAIWSTPPQNMLDYPSSTLLRFMKNHGLLGIGTQFTWKTVAGGSRNYREKLIAPFKSKIKISKGVSKVIRNSDSVVVIDEEGEQQSFDKVILASHADQSLEMIEQPTNKEKLLLSCFKYNKNPVVLHSDDSVMPRNRKAWASWNYRIEGHDISDPQSSTHYWMNNLQNVSDEKNYFVSVDYKGSIAEEKVHWQTVYEHPRFDINAIHAQKKLKQLNEDGPVYYCGSYFRYGFHEDALMSAMDLCDHILEESEVVA